jgi:hypothetical protein
MESVLRHSNSIVGLIVLASLFAPLQASAQNSCANQFVQPATTGDADTDKSQTDLSAADDAPFVGLQPSPKVPSIEQMSTDAQILMKAPKGHFEIDYSQALNWTVTAVKYEQEPNESIIAVGGKVVDNSGQELAVPVNKMIDLNSNDQPTGARFSLKILSSAHPLSVALTPYSNMGLARQTENGIVFEIPVKYRVGGDITEFVVLRIKDGDQVKLRITLYERHLDQARTISLESNSF